MRRLALAESQPHTPWAGFLDPFAANPWAVDEDLAARTSHKRAREEGEPIGEAADGSSPITITEPASDRAGEEQAEPAPESAATATAAANQQGAEMEVEEEELPSGPVAAELTALRHELSVLAGVAQAAGQVDEAGISACTLRLQTLVACCTSAGGARAAFDAVGLAEAPEPALTIVTPHFAAAECSGRAAARFVGAVLLPRVRALVKPASRALFHVALSLIAHHPRALGDELLLPLMWLPAMNAAAGGAAASRGATPQAEAAGRLLKEMPAAELSRLLGLFLRGGGGGGGG